MKKIISIILCAAALLLVSVFGVNAKVDENIDNNLIKTLSTTNISANKVRIYTYNIGSNCTGGVGFAEEDVLLDSVYVAFKDCINSPKELFLPREKGYLRYLAAYNNNLQSWRPDFWFRYTDGEKYVKVRIKLSDWSSLFNEDGTCPVYSDYLGKNVYLDFKENGEGAGAVLMLTSGNAVTAAAPDENGCVEFYFSTRIGDGAYFSIGSYNMGYPHVILFGLVMGNVDNDGGISISDATLIQKYAAGLETMGANSRFLADVNGDGVINVMDSTEIQRYLAN